MTMPPRRDTPLHEPVQYPPRGLGWTTPVLSVRSPVMRTPIQITMDCVDPARMEEFWAAALGYVRQPPPEGFASWADYAVEQDIPPSQWRGSVVDPAGEGPRLLFQTVPEDKVVKNRVHLDLTVTAGLPAEERGPAISAKIDDLVAIGAIVARTVTEYGDTFAVLMDPEGNEFCVQ
jgi:Glyoxalase-like domain